MPQLTRLQILQLSLLILAVPVQYLLSRSSTENFRQYELKRVMSSISDLNGYLSLTGWLKWCRNFWDRLREDRLSEDEPPAEVLENLNTEGGHFATSTEPRAPRAPHVKYRVGQVFKHKIHGYRGVIIGWDETARAPTHWLDKMHPTKEMRTLPNYSVLIDTRDRLTPQLAYIPEENIALVENVKIMHPLVEHYFEQWDGAQYLLRPWLRKVYPQD